MEKLSCRAPGPSYDELKELFQLSLEGYLSSSPFLFSCGLKNADCRSWENPEKIDNFKKFSLQELNVLYADEAKELIQKGRAHERAKLVRVSAEGYLPEPIPVEVVGQVGVDVKELLNKSKANLRVLKELSRNSGDFEKVKALLKTIVDASE